MCNIGKKILGFTITLFIVFYVIASTGYAEVGKIGYVDLRRAFYEYDKTKEMEEELTGLTEKSQDERTALVEKITKLRDEGELAAGAAKEQKQIEIKTELENLLEYARNVRQELLNKKNDMFREVVDDIQKVVEEIGRQEQYDYIIDSRNVMYAKEMYDLTDRVIDELKK